MAHQPPREDTEPLLDGALTRMAMGYFRSRALVAAAWLGLADLLADGTRTLPGLAEATHADAGALHRLLRALAGFGIVIETAPGVFALTDAGRTLRRDVPDSERDAVLFWGDLLADSWAGLTDCIRSGETTMARRAGTGERSRWSEVPEASDIFRAVMGTAPAEDYEPLVGACALEAAGVVADLGGGGGALICAVLHCHPHLRGMLVDRAETVPLAAARLEDEGLAERCGVQAADLAEAVPPGADVYLLKHVLHGYDDDGAAAILRNCRAALPANGRLLLLEFVLPETVCAPDPALEGRLMSDLNMLVVTGGKERSASQWRALLDLAGLRCTCITPVPGHLVSVVEAAP